LDFWAITQVLTPAPCLSPISPAPTSSQPSHVSTTHRFLITHPTPSRPTHQQLGTINNSSSTIGTCHTSTNHLLGLLSSTNVNFNINHVLGLYQYGGLKTSFQLEFSIYLFFCKKLFSPKVCTMAPGFLRKLKTYFC
jgi:hypothetical protein